MPSPSQLQASPATTLIGRPIPRLTGKLHPPLPGSATLVDPVFHLSPETDTTAFLPIRPARRPAPRWVLLLGLGLLAGAALHGAPGPRPAPVAARTSASVPVPAIRASGKVEAVQQAHVRSRVAGVVAEVAVQEGQAIRAGDLLLRLDQADQERQIERTAAEVHQRRAELRQVEARHSGLDPVTDPAALRTDLPAPGSDLALARARLKAAQAAHRAAREMARDGTILAPFDGWVIARQVHPGEALSADAAQPALVLAQAGALAVRVELSAADATRVGLGQPARIQRPTLTYPRGLQGRVVSAAAPPQQAAGGRERFPVRVMLDPGQDLSAVVPGMLADVEFPPASTSAR